MLSGCQERWDYWGGHGALELLWSSSETDLHFVRCLEEAEYEGQLA